jgi:putative glycosyltransferase (TIGR04372 family)
LDLYWFDLPISNDFFAAMVQRTFHVSPFVCPLDLWNQILPGGAMHHLPPVGMLQLSSDIQDWQKMIQEVLPFSPEEDAWAKAWLCQQGWHEGEPFVCLLVRDSSYMDNTYPNTTPPEETGAKYHPKYGYGWNHLNYRDSDISTYVPAAEWLAGQGVWVLRMGKVMARPIPSNHSRLIDYAFHPEKSDFLDIWLFAHCDLCVSTGTGIDTISDIYCRPILYLNYLPLWMTTSFSNTTHLPKTLLWQASGIPLNCKEYFALNTHSEYYDRIGIRIIDLTPEEILSAVQEQWQRLQGTWVDTEEDLQRYQRFWEILDSLPQFPGWHGWIQFKARVGATWLRSKGDDFLN